MKLIVHPDFASLQLFVENLPERFEKEGTTLYKVRNEIKVFLVDNQWVNVKRYGVPHLFNRVAYSWFRKSKASRAYENAVRISQLGFDTPAPIAYLETYTNGLLHDTYFVSLQCPYMRQIKEFAEDSPIGDRTSIVEALGRYVAKLHQAGVYHKDLSNGNILFEADSAGTRFSLIDLNRMDFGTIGMRKGCRNFNRLRAGDAFFRLIARSYSSSRGFDEDTCLRLINRSLQKSMRYFSRKSTFKKWRKEVKIIVKRGE